MPILIIALITLLAGGGGTIVASQNSLPGEGLFPIKLAAENFQLALAMGDDSKKELSINFAEKRVKEINDLLESLQGQEVEAHHLKGLDRAAENLHANLARVEDKAKNLRTGGQNSRALEMNEDLKATAGILNQALELERDSSNEPELRNRLDNAITRNEDLRRGAENEIRGIMEIEQGDDNPRSASGRIGAAENRIAQVERRLDSRGNGLRPETIEESQRGLDSARDLLEAAGVDISAGQFEDALTRANEAFRTAALANALISADNELRNIEDNPNRMAENVRRENRQLETGISIEARVLGSATDVRVEARFPISTADKNAVAQAIVDRLRLSRDAVANLIEIRRNEVASLQTQSEARADVENGGADVRVKIRFPLNTTDNNAIIQGIANRLAVMSVSDVMSALDLRGSGNQSSDSDSQRSGSADNSRRELELGDDRLFRSNPIPSSGIDVRGQEAELRGRANEPGEDVRGQEQESRNGLNNDDSGLRGDGTVDDNLPRNSGLDDNGLRGNGTVDDNLPRQSGLDDNGLRGDGTVDDNSASGGSSSGGGSVDDNPGAGSGGGSSSGGESSGGSSGGSGGGSSSGGGGSSGGGSSDD